MTKKKLSEKKTVSSTVIFFWIGAALVSMFGFMLVCKSMGVLNPRENWEHEFSELSEILITTHHENLRVNPGSEQLTLLLKKYAGHQLELKLKAEFQPVGGMKKFLNKKQLSVINFSTEGTDQHRFTFAIYPIATRQFAKTYKFAQGSFLWHAYSWQTGLVSMKVVSENQKPPENQLNIVAANYMNDYFIFVVGDQSHVELVNSLYSTMSLYKSDFIKTL
jgi:hypothetical protein